MTEKEIDDYYRMQKEKNLKRYYAIRANRTIREDRGRLIRLAFMTVLSLVVCMIFLNMNFRVQQQIYRVSVLQKEIEELRLENEDAQKRIEDAGDWLMIQEKALSYGMGYPKQGNVVYYTVDDSDYMYQTGDIPEQ